MHGGDAGWGWMVVMMLGMVLFWGAVILGIVWLARASPEDHREQTRETALETLDRRFAEGAISADEDHHRRDVLSAGGQSGRPTVRG
jgi:putative membrane protein